MDIHLQVDFQDEPLLLKIVEKTLRYSETESVEIVSFIQYSHVARMFSPYTPFLTGETLQDSCYAISMSMVMKFALITDYT